MNSVSQIHPVMNEVKTVIDSEETAKEMGRWDAENGLKCQPDSYHFTDANSIHGSYLKGDYTFAYIPAKGL